jgi:ribosome-associated toxin RatA of RatAB toxin-antitoxin module
MTSPTRGSAPRALAADPERVHPGVPRDKLRRPYQLGGMPLGRAMVTVDEAVVAAPMARIFELAWRVEEWPTHLAHYRFVRFRARTRDGGGLVEMSANRPFGAFAWPTWWLSEMEVRHDVPSVRFRHVDGVTKEMEVEWQFEPTKDSTDRAPRTAVRIVHLWDGPRWPLIGVPAALAVIGPVFVHGIASRTLAGLQRVAEAGAGYGGQGSVPGT